MNIKRILVASTAAAALLGTSACVTDPNTGEQKISRTAIGGLGGVLAGGLLGGLIGDKTGRIIGAAAGGAIGGYVGYRMDEQIKELRTNTAGTGVDVSEVDGGDAILVNLPDGVTFATGSANINQTFRNTLDRVAESLVQYPNSLIDVYGYTDSTGSDAFNQRLSEQRAQAVANYLTSRGVAQTRIQSQGFGEDERYAVASNDTAEGRAMNRRVEIKIVPISQDEVRQAQGM
ncbi:putative lipoprotein YiaD [Alteripontixanthobacter maritimus]|uniref:Putative lipoprotein YiaD n=1 Tax=Alteripontixanthobacter maritimus TaxID=2161824 RepID=A0A369Q8P2_9SPHN|nr:OmpA family protein [Alteripontixanthobacter maritimus]RDC61084.1 putative lipoprotein YiaD [Alteripontixanthobacter maritimus]